MNSRYTFGACSTLGKTTMPLRTSLRRTFLSANEADCPAMHTDTGMRFRSIERILVGMNCPSESGPTRTLSPAWIAPEQRSGNRANGWFTDVEIHTAFDNARHDGADKRHGKGVVDVELERRVRVVVAVVR